jgi:16S rRNA (uracil1498-N3)-methyltransferase
MRETRLFVPEPLTIETACLLKSEQSHYLVNVLRLKDGDSLQVFNGTGGEFTALLQNQGKQWLVLPKMFFADDKLPRRKVQLVLCLLKGEKLEWVLQKVTELGVAQIILVACQRSVLRLKASDWPKKVAHWQKILIAACEQSGRNRLPSLHYAETFDLAWEILSKDQQHSEQLWASPTGESSLFRFCSQAHTADKTLTLWIGAEGGFADEENLWLHSRSQAVRLTPTILRAETAAISAVALAVHSAETP